ncbi:MAG: alanine--glyoxylate aminotransferase family protein [Candidatus Kapabacteria bacterium]|nr:alanine--glyoxylate aminotransferase family protein [Candidatus Kapabacteria bacterium]
MRLFTPGPVPVSAAVLAACAAPPLFHRGKPFMEMSQRVWQNLRAVYRTEYHVVVLAGSGMTGIEAAMASTLAPGDTVVVLEHGRFGARLATIAERYGAAPSVLRVPWGETITAAMVEEYLRPLQGVRHVWLVHSETSTGVALELEAIARSIRRVAPDTLIGVDAITSMAIHAVETDAWDLDLVVSASQKGFACPPGLATVGISPRAEARMRARPASTYTLHLPTVVDSMKQGLFPWTPPVTLIAGLDVALDVILAEGLDLVWQRHADLARYTQSALADRGFTLFGDGSSHAVTVIADERASQIKRGLLEKHDIVIAGGQDLLQDKVFRIGTCGNVHRADIEDLMRAIDDVLTTVVD